MAFKGVDVPPYFRILPPSVNPHLRGTFDGLTLLRIESGAGFGVGTHETTQLCLLATGQWIRSGFKPRRVLDFGAGSGILSIAAALAGAQVEAVEISVEAIENARLNLHHNHVERLVELRQTLSEPPAGYDLILANILAKVLLEHAMALCSRVAPGGRLVLSGLVATDVPGILAAYKPLLGSMRHEVYARNDWRAVTFTP